MFFFSFFFVFFFSFQPLLSLEIQSICRGLTNIYFLFLQVFVNFKISLVDPVQGRGQWLRSLSGLTALSWLTFSALGCLPQVSLYSSCSAQLLNVPTSQTSTLALSSFSHIHYCSLAILPMPITSVIPSRALTSRSVSPDPIAYVRNPDMTLTSPSSHLDNQILQILPPDLSPLLLPPLHPHCSSLSAGLPLEPAIASSPAFLPPFLSLPTPPLHRSRCSYYQAHPCSNFSVQRYLFICRPVNNYRPEIIMKLHRGVPERRVLTKAEMRDQTGGRVAGNCG